LIEQMIPVGRISGLDVLPIVFVLLSGLLGFFLGLS
jgi:hypothetical protein